MRNYKLYFLKYYIIRILYLLVPSLRKKHSNRDPIDKYLWFIGFCNGYIIY